MTNELYAEIERLKDDVERLTREKNEAITTLSERCLAHIAAKEKAWAERDALRAEVARLTELVEAHDTVRREDVDRAQRETEGARIVWRKAHELALQERNTALSRERKAREALDRIRKIVDGGPLRNAPHFNTQLPDTTAQWNKRMGDALCQIGDLAADALSATPEAQGCKECERLRVVLGGYKRATQQLANRLEDAFRNPTNPGGNVTAYSCDDEFVRRCLTLVAWSRSMADENDVKAAQELIASRPSLRARIAELDAAPPVPPARETPDVDGPLMDWIADLLYRQRVFDRVEVCNQTARTILRSLGPARPDEVSASHAATRNKALEDAVKAVGAVHNAFSYGLADTIFRVDALAAVRALRKP